LRFSISLASKRFVLFVLITAVSISRLSVIADESGGEFKMVTMKTSFGVIELELDAGSAPVTVQNFTEYVESGHYNGTLFHRVIPGFMIQGGGMGEGLIERQTRVPIENEADNGLRNLRGSIAMARTNEPQSATAQFFINLNDNSFLDHSEKTSAGWGYAVFGKVISGLNIVDEIAAVKTGSVGNHDDVPLEDVLLEHITILGGQ
tara:strand:+ start:237 stop:851 length:615 start_codon:yes stop_codon:yes gene_type:complete